MERTDYLKRKYGLIPHEEGGYFSEVYKSSFADSGRPFMGSIYFLLEGDEISHFHRIDCDEIWYFHEGCGMEITTLIDGKMYVHKLGKENEENEDHMLVIPKGAIFAARNTDIFSYSFVSCATTPAFSYDGFNLISRRELFDMYPGLPSKIYSLAF